MLQSAISPQVAQVFDIAKAFTMSERLTLAKLLLDSLVIEAAKSETDVDNAGSSTFANSWDSSEDIIWDKPTKPAEGKIVYQTKRIGNLHPSSFQISGEFDEPLPDEFWLGES